MIGFARDVGCDFYRQKRAFLFPFLFCLLILVLIISGCTGSEYTLMDSDLRDIPLTRTVPSATITATATIEPTITATPFISLHEGQALPDDLAVITGKNIKKLQEIGRWGNGVAYDMVWSPDGRQIAISTSRYLLLVDVQSREISKRIVTDFPLYRIAFSPDSRKLYGGGTQGKLLVCDITDESQEIIIQGNILPMTAIAVSHNGQYVASADWQNAVHLWNMENDILQKNFASTLSGSKTLGFSRDDEVVFSWSPLEPITGWHILTAQQPLEYYFGLDANQHTGSSVRISADGSAAAVNQTWQMRVQNLTDGTTLGVMKDFYYEVKDLDISADGEWTLSLHSDQVRLWQSSKSKMIASYDLADVADQLPVAIRISPDGMQFVLLGQDLIFFRIDAKTQEITQADIMPVNLATDLSFAAQLHTNDVLYQVGLDGALYETALESGEEVQSDFTMEHQISAYTVSESIFAVGYENDSIEIRDLQSLEVEKTLARLSRMPVALQISEPMDVIIAQTEKNVTGTWEISTGNFLAKQEWDIALDDLRLSHDKRYLLGSGDGQTQIFGLDDEWMSDVLNGRLLAVSQKGILLQRYGNEAGLVVLDLQSLNVLRELNGFTPDKAVFSADERLLAMSGKDLLVYDMENSQVELQIENPARGAEFFFSSDGRLLLFVNADGSMLLYGVPN